LKNLHQKLPAIFAKIARYFITIKMAKKLLIMPGGSSANPSPFCPYTYLVGQSW
jgi:hypothetical protein